MAPVPIMVRFDDDIAEKLRERAHKERRSLNRLINDAMRFYVEGGDQKVIRETARRETMARFRERMKEVNEMIAPLSNQETQGDYNAGVRVVLKELADAIAFLGAVVAPDVSLSAPNREKTLA